MQKYCLWARAERLENIFGMLLQKKSLLPRLLDKTAAGQGMAEAYAYMAEYSGIDSEYKEQYRKTAALMRAAVL